MDFLSKYVVYFTKLIVWSKQNGLCIGLCVNRRSYLRATVSGQTNKFMWQTVQLENVIWDTLRVTEYTFCIDITKCVEFINSHDFIPNYIRQGISGVNLLNSIE